MPDSGLEEAIRARQIADALPEDQDPDELYTTPDDTSGDQEPADQQPAHNPNAQSLADYPSQPVAAATRDITPGVAPPGPEYAGVAEDQAPKVVQPGAVPSPLPEVLQPEYAGISSDQEGGAAPDIVPQVERGQLVKLPPTRPVSAASAEVTPGVTPPVTEPAPDTLTQVERATPVSLPPPQPVAQASRELALRAQLMKLPPVQPVAAVEREITPGAVQGAPGALTQVERAQPVTGEAPATLAGVERGQLVDSDSDQAQLELASLYGANVPGGTITQAPQGQARVRLNPNDQSLEDYSKPVVAPPAQAGQGAVQQAAQQPAAQQPAAQPAPPVTTNPDGTEFPQRVQAVGGKDPVAFIMHHTGGRGTVQDVLDTLNQRGLGVEYVTDRDGNIFQTGGSGAQHILPGWGPKGTGLSNRNVVGMEVIAKNDADVLQVQKDSIARFMATRFPTTSILGHGEVNPGHKEADEGQSTKAAALAYREQQAQGGSEQGDQAARAEPATKGTNGLYPNEKPTDFYTGRASVFATDDDIKSGQDNGVGNSKLGTINTHEAAGVAIPIQALIANLGNNPAAWRRARLDVVDMTTGKRSRLPIVDTGPRADVGAIVDQTPWVANYFGGDKTLSIRLVPNAGPDITKDPQRWDDEQASIKSGRDSSTMLPGAQKIQGLLNYQLVSPDADAHAKVMAADAANQAKMRSTLTQLPEAESGNMIGFYNRLSSSVPGIPDSMRTSVQAELKPQIIAAMRAKFPEIKTDQEAWAQATSNVNILDIGREWWDKTVGNLQGLTNVMQKGRTGADQFSVDQYLQKVLPGATDQQRQDYLHRYYMMSPEQQAQEIGSHLPGQFGLTGAYPSEQSQTVIQALKHLADPAFQQRQAQELAQSTADMKQNLRGDPRLIGTGMGKAIDAIGQIPAVLATFSNPIMWPVGLAQANEQIKDGLKSDHPDWNEKQLQDGSTYATLVSFFGQAAAAEIMGGGGGALMNALRGRGAKAIAQVAFGSGSAAAISGGSQVATNALTGAPVMRGVGDAAITGAIQGAVTGGVHGVGELAQPGEKAITAPEVRPSTEPPPSPTLEQRPPPPPTEPERPPVEPPPVEPPPVEPPPERPPVEQGPIYAMPGGEQPESSQTRMVRNAYEDIRKGQMGSAVYLSDIANKLGLDPEEIKQWASQAQASGEATFDPGHWPSATPEQRAAAIGVQTPRGTEQRLMVRFPEREAPPTESGQGISYTPSRNVPSALADLVRSDSLADAAKAAAVKFQDPVARDIATHVANLVPPEAKIGVADFTQPVQANGKEYSGEVSAGLYHPLSKTALISEQTNNPEGAVLHEATHAALNNAILNPETLSEAARAGVAQIHDAYQKALTSAPRRRPPWLGYGLSSPEEFVSAAVSDPRFQQWLRDRSTPGTLQGLLQGAARVLGVKRNVPGDLYERTIGAISAVDQVGHATGSGGPIYAANPFSPLARSGLPNGLKTVMRYVRQKTATMRSNLDATPETRRLSHLMDLADDRKDALFGQRAQMVKELQRLAPGAQRKVIEQEFQRMAEQVDKGQAPTTTNPVAREIWERMAKVKGEDAQFMRDNEFHVQLPDGTWRPFVGVKDPAMYVARSMRPDVMEALRAPREPNGNYTPEFNKIFNEGLQKGFFTKPEDLEAHVPQIGQGLTQGPRSTQLETARTVKLPRFFYDYTLDGQLRNIYGNADTRARLEAFGQSRPGHPDEFQKTIEGINKSLSLTARQKQIAVNNVKYARDVWYHENSKGIDEAIMGNIKAGTSAIQTGNFFTSAKVAVGRLFFSMQNPGVVNTGKALIDTLAHYGSSKDTARDFGIIKDAITFQHEDLLTPETAFRRFVRLTMEASGHGEAGRFANTVDMKASQIWLESAKREIANNPNSTASRMAKEIIARRGVDLGKLQAGDIPETQKFLRQWVNDAQTSYRLMDSPVWSKTAFGRLVFSYQDWAYNTTRMLFKETINPALAAYARGDIGLGTRYAGRLLYFAAAAAGAEELNQAIREWIFGRESTAPSWGQFWNAVHNQDNGLAEKLILGRAMDELIGGTFLGMGGDFARTILNYTTGRNEVSNAWRPNSPPAQSVSDAVFNLFNNWKNQGGNLSGRDLSQFWDQMFSGQREIRNVIQSLAIHYGEATGAKNLPIPGYAEAKGYRERLFAQAKFRQFTNEPEGMDFRKPQITGAVTTPSTYYYEKIEDALYAGDSARGKALIAQMAQDPKAAHDNLGRALKTSMTARQPVPGSNAGKAFHLWALKNLSPEDLERIEDAQNAYVKTAIDAGIFDKASVKTHAIGATPRKPSGKLMRFIEEREAQGGGPDPLDAAIRRSRVGRQLLAR